MGEKSILRFVTRGSRVAAIIGGVLIFISAALITIDIFGRIFLDKVLVQSFEVSRFLFAVAVAFSLSFATVEKAHIRIDLFVTKFAQRWQAIINILSIFSLSVLSSFMSLKAFDVLANSWKIGARSRSVLAVPLTLPQSFWFLGVVWFSIVCLTLVFVAVKRALRGNWRGVNVLVGVPSADDEVEHFVPADKAVPSHASGTSGGDV